mmetsp:Transcript_104349/g.319450  ORF Transcript_104349/g.319450 Transcript_104349/m.319450 type:complete len:224 (-) Transcript_104349:702-1373(-)
MRAPDRARSRGRGHFLPLLRGPQHLHAHHVRPEHLGDRHRAVLVLERLQDRDNHSRNCACSAVKRVRKFGTLLVVLLLESDVQAPRLVIGAIAARRDLAPLLHAGHPRLHVVLPVRRRPELLRRHVQHPEAKPQLGVQVLFELPDRLQHRVGLLRVAPRHSEELNLAELVQAVDAPALRAGRSSLCPEGVAEGAQPLGQLLGGDEGLVHEDACQRDLGRAGQV